MKSLCDDCSIDDCCHCPYEEAAFIDEFSPENLDPISKYLNLKAMRNNREYQICKDIAIYMRLQYPNIIFHFDLAGLNLSRAQAGMMKAIQGGRGYPDLFIAEPRLIFRDDDDLPFGTNYYGLFIEVKKGRYKVAQKRYDLHHPSHSGQMELHYSFRKTWLMARIRSRIR